MTSKLKRLKENKHMLYVLKDSSPKLRKAILKHSSDDLVAALNEIAFNVASGNHSVSNSDKNKLKRYKSHLRSFIKPSNSLSSKRKILVQSGSGFVPILLSLILDGVIGKLLQK